MSDLEVQRIIGRLEQMALAASKGIEDARIRSIRWITQQSSIDIGRAIITSVTNANTVVATIVGVAAS